MECPRDAVDMKELVCRDDTQLQLCETCGGVWIDGGDLNRVLLHNNLPGLDSMGGKADLDQLTDRCPKDQVDLILIEGGDKSDPHSYLYCEACAGFWLELDVDADADGEAVEAEIVAFFKGFRPPGARVGR